MRLWFRAADLAPHDFCLALFAASAYGASPFATVAPSALASSSACDSRAYGAFGLRSVAADNDVGATAAAVTS